MVAEINIAGVVGLGKMGAARHIARGGFDVVG